MNKREDPVPKIAMPLQR